MKLLLKTFNLSLLLLFSTSALVIDTTSLQRKVHGYQERKLAHFKLRLHNTLEDLRIRRARSTSEQDESSHYEVPNVVAKESESSNLVQAVATWSVAYFNGVEVVFAGTEEGSISLFHDSELTSLCSFPTNEPIYSLLSFDYGNGLWLVGLHEKLTNEDFMQVYECNSTNWENAVVTPRQHIPVYGESLFELMNIENRIYLLSVTNTDNDALLRLFVWKGTQFDIIHDLQLKGKCESLAVWELNKVLFVAVSLFDRGQLQVFKYAENNGKLIAVDILEGTFRVVTHFEVVGHHYLVCESGTRLVFFWWNGGYFLKQQEIPFSDTESVIDISVLDFTRDVVVLVVAKPNLLEYYMQDSSISYSRTGSTPIAESVKLKSINIWEREDKVFYLLPVFQSYQAATIFKLDVDITIPSSDLETSSLLNCTLELNDTLVKIDEELEEVSTRLSSIWMKEKVLDLSTVTVEGNVESEYANISEVFLMNDNTSQSVLPVLDFYKQLHHRVNTLNLSLKNSVKKSGYQEIEANITFVGDLKASLVNINSLESHLQINGVHTQSLLSTLKIVGEQSFSNSVCISFASVNTINTTMLNYKEVEDYVLLKKKPQILRGNITFKDISAANMRSEMYTLNRIKLSDIFSSVTPQIVLDKKIFDSLTSKIITSKGNVSGVDMRKLEKSVLKNTSRFEKKLYFLSDVIAANMTVHSFNGLYALNLTVCSVKQSGNEFIKGLKMFAKPIRIRGELSVLEHVNHLNLNHLMTLDSPQNISGDVDFFNISFNEIETHSVNGIDLCSEAIQKYGNFEVYKMVNFTQSLKLSNITMKDKVSIDTVDLSSVVPYILEKNHEVFNGTFVFRNISVLQDVEIDEVSLALLLKNLSDSVWLKNKSQNILYGHFIMFSARNLLVNTVNGIPISDIVKCNSNTTIDSAKKFEDVEVHSISIHDGKTLSGIGFTAGHLNSTFADFLKNFTVKNMFIRRDLSLPAINDVNMSDWMQSKEFQNCSGIKKFDVIFVDKLTASKLDFSNFSMKSFADYKLDSIHLPPDKMIINKEFENLAGNEMDYHGFLNGRSFKEMFQSVVTLKTHQNITSDIKFFYPLWIRTLFVKNLINVTDLRNVVVTNRAESSIPSKEFIGSFFVNNVNLGRVNGVNITYLWKNAFFKRGNNTVSQWVNFQSSLKTKQIQISPSATIDRIHLNDSIRIDESLYEEYMNYSTVFIPDINIHGTINGCTLLDIFGTEPDELKIIAVKYINGLNIYGDLHIKTAVNGVSDNEFSIVASYLNSDEDFKGNFYFSSINATYLQVPHFINDVDINFMLRDAVKQHTLEAIKGKKIFRKKLHCNSTYISSLNATNLSGVNIPLLYRKYLSKEAPQTLSIKNLQSVHARNVAVTGFLNELRLPHDLVLTDTTEKISSPVFFNHIINVTDINVEGLVDDQSLHFLNEKVSLINFGNISSKLIFLKDAKIKGDMEVKGSINNVKLNETIRNVNKSVIFGLKRFQETLLMLSHLDTLTPVNNISLQLLLKNICRMKADENITERVNLSSLQTSSLNVGTINHISLERLWKQIHDIEENVHATLDNLTESINKDEDALSIVKDNIDSSLFLYGFFELHQVLNLGSTLKFLPIFESGIFGDTIELPTLQMVVWAVRNESCRSFKSVLMDIYANGTLAKIEKVYARVFPFALRILEEEVQSFNLHTDRGNRCREGKQKPDFIKTIFISGNATKNTIDSPMGSIILDAKLLEMDSGVYIVIVYEFEGDGERMLLYKYNSIDDNWILHQNLHSWHISSFDMIFVDDIKHVEVYLAVTSEITKSGVFLYHWNFKDEKFSLTTSDSKSVSSSALWVSNDEDVFLLLTKEYTKIRKDDGWTYEYTDPVEVHNLQEDLKLDHEINIQGIHSFETFNMDGETFVLAVSRHLQIVYVLQYRGFNGFEVIQVIGAPGVVGVTVFASLNNDIFLAVSSRTGHTRILKCVTRGGKIIYH